MCGVDSRGSEQGPLAGCCECGDEPSGSGATELIRRIFEPKKREHHRRLRKTS
jgi:hypothetical protein